MRPVARLLGLVTAVILGIVLASPPSFAAKILTVTCDADDGLVTFPSGTASVTVVATLESGASATETLSISPKRADVVFVGNDTTSALARLEATAMSKTGKVLATGSATCS